MTIRKILMGTVAATMLLGASGTAMAKCEIVDDELRKSVVENEKARRQIPGTLIRDARDLRNAAAKLAAYGKDDACEKVAESVRDLLRDPKKAQQVYLKDGMAKRVDANRPLDDRGWAEYRRQRIATAKPVQEVLGRLRADEMIGADVENMKGNELGEVEDILIGAGDKSGYLIVSHGGFLGIGDKQIAVPLEKFRVSRDHDTFYIAMTEKQIEAAPSFDRGRFDWVEDGDWLKKNDAYYQKVRVSAGQNTDAGRSRSADKKPVSGKPSQTEPKK